jgi:hypothetical protein
VKRPNGVERYASFLDFVRRIAMLPARSPTGLVVKSKPVKRLERRGVLVLLSLVIAAIAIFMLVSP